VKAILLSLEITASKGVIHSATTSVPVGIVPLPGPEYAVRMKRYSISVVFVILACFTAAPGIPAKWEVPATEVIRGPLLGSPAPDSVAIWMQTAIPMTIRIHALEKGEGEGLSEVYSKSIRLESGNRRMGIFHLEGLKAKTSYRYFVENPGGDIIWPEGDRDENEFKTPPEIGEPCRFSFSTGSGANSWIRPFPEVWESIAKERPDFFIALGDTPYADGMLWFESQEWEDARARDEREHSAVSREKRKAAAGAFLEKAREAIPMAYEYFREAPEFSRLFSSSFWIATWDDHDTGLNDGDREDPVLRLALETFKAFTPNPSFGLPEAPGSYWILHWGDVDFFLLDDQSFRTPGGEKSGDPKGATILGSAQMAWLVKNLRQSTATFKILVSGSPFNDSSRKSDAWGTYPGDRKKLIDTIVSSKIEGVILLSGDIHRSEVYSLPWLDASGGYPLVEVVSSPLYQRARACGPSVDGRVFCMGSSEGEILELFARFEIDTTGSDKKILIEVRSSAGEVYFSSTIRASDLRWGRSRSLD